MNLIESYCVFTPILNSTSKQYVPNFIRFSKVTFELEQCSRTTHRSDSHLFYIIKKFEIQCFYIKFLCKLDYVVHNREFTWKIISSAQRVLYIQFSSGTGLKHLGIYSHTDSINLTSKHRYLTTKFAQTVKPSV